MLAMAHAGFVLLSMPKTGSTALQKRFDGHAQLAVRKPPTMKHMRARTFEARIAPVLEAYGFPRASYELVCLVREPVDWVASWWRYRARPGFEGRPRYTGNLSFEEFAEQVLAGEVQLGSSANFVSDLDGNVIVERVYRYEHLEQASAWMAERLGLDLPAPARANASPPRPLDVSARTRARLEEHYAADVEVYRSAR